MAKGKSDKEEDDVVLMEEFGGPLGNLGFIVFSHFIMYYIWYCVQINDTAIAIPTPAFWADFVDSISKLAVPTLYSAQLYLGFLGYQVLLALTMPGFTTKGLPVPSEGGKALTYHCNGVISWYVTIATLAGLQYFGYFDLSTVISYTDENGKNVHVLGSLMSFSILFADFVSIVAYITGLFSGKAVRMSGNHIYDFFMGAWLNPRIGDFDFKFFAETRFPWMMLVTLSVAAAMKQNEEFGEVCYSFYFIILAQGLYTNAVMKGEELIPVTWDIFYEKWGFMLIYWNLSGVPFVYSTGSFVIQKLGLIELPTWFKVYLLISFLFVYWVWDTCNSQKTRFRQQMQGTFTPRWTFPQLPWGTLKMPIKKIETKNGSTLLVDGWYQYARKINYSSDMYMSLCWGMCTGLNSFFPYFYFSFFFGVLIHRWIRDDHRCALKYGEDWEKYKKMVPYVFIPYVF
jgi:delta24(24(1))-sterol reductase